MSPKPGFLYFTVDARHLRQLGRELVADRKTALAELVKNAYDADATRVWVDFIDPSEGGVLEIRDNGEGMTLEVVREAWMRLSTAYKERQPLSACYRRIRAGQKGIGRFAAETLGRRLVLSSTTEGSSTCVVVEFDWVRFDELDVPLHEIGNTYRIEPASQEEHGTCLRIEGLWQAWGEEDRKGVRRVIQLLQPPFPIADAYGAEAITASASTATAYECRPMVSMSTIGYTSTSSLGSAKCFPLSATTTGLGTSLCRDTATFFSSTRPAARGSSRTKRSKK